MGTALVAAVDITSASSLTVAWHRSDLKHTLGFPLCASTGAHASNANLDTCRVSVGEDGTAAVFTGGKGSWRWLSLVLEGQDGSVVGNHTYGKTHHNAIAIDTSRGTLWDAGFQDDKLPGGNPVQVCSVFCHAYRQNSSCPSAPLYDYAGKDLATNQADTRVSFVGFHNGTLYFAGRAAGGNSVFRYQPHDLNTQVNRWSVRSFYIDDMIHTH